MSQYLRDQLASVLTSLEQFLREQQKQKEMEMTEEKGRLQRQLQAIDSAEKSIQDIKKRFDLISKKAEALQREVGSLLKTELKNLQRVAT